MTASIDPNDYLFDEEIDEEMRFRFWGIDDSKTPPGRMTDDILVIRKILIEFYQDWRNGNISNWQSDPLFIWEYLGRDLTEEEIENMLQQLEDGFNKEAGQNTWHMKGYEISIPYVSFPDDIKRCLAQRIVQEFDMPKKRKKRGWKSEEQEEE